MAVLTATGTGAVAAALGGTGSHVWGAGAYVAVSGIALFSPGAIAAQVILGQVLAGSLLLAPDGPAPLLLLPLVVGVVVTAELLGCSSGADVPVPALSAGALRRVGGTAVLGGGAFGTVVWIGGLSGPTGIEALALAAAACVALAGLLAREPR
jgi:hypothetical protein